MKIAFCAMPVTDNLDSYGYFRPERRAFFSELVAVIENAGYEVLSAGTNERWGEVKLMPVEFTEFDVEAILRADLFVMVTNERLNRDMYLELGVAVARGIPIVALMAASTKLTYMGMGLTELNRMKVARYDSDAEAPELLAKLLAEVSLPTAAA
jgi:nucleoside 2-deoxyribosyltransferase